MEATLSTTTVFISGSCSLLTSAVPEHAWQADHLRESERIRRGPLAGRFAIDALRGGHDGIRRCQSLDERRPGSIEHFHLAGDARLRGDEQRFDVAAHRLEMLAFMHE